MTLETSIKGEKSLKKYSYQNKPRQENASEFAECNIKYT